MMQIHSLSPLDFVGLKVITFSGHISNSSPAGFTHESILMNINIHEIYTIAGLKEDFELQDLVRNNSCKKKVLKTDLFNYIIHLYLFLPNNHTILPL